jgi:hypothetical protein
VSRPPARAVVRGPRGERAAPPSRACFRGGGRVQHRPRAQRHRAQRQGEPSDTSLSTSYVDRPQDVTDPLKIACCAQLPRRAQSNGTSIDQAACVGSSTHSACSESSLPVVCLVCACTFGFGRKAKAQREGAPRSAMPSTPGFRLPPGMAYATLIRCGCLSSHETNPGANCRDCSVCR